MDEIASLYNRIGELGEPLTKLLLNVLVSRILRLLALLLEFTLLTLLLLRFCLLSFRNQVLLKLLVREVLVDELRRVCAQVFPFVIRKIPKGVFQIVPDDG